MLGLVALVEVCSFAAVYWSTRNNAIAQGQAELNVGGRVFQRLLASRGGQLQDNMRVLASDFAFKQAVGTADRTTIESALANQAARIGADFAMLVLPDGRIGAGTQQGPAHADEICSKFFQASQHHGSLTDVADVGGRPYQVTVVPVYAPIPIGWVCMGNAMDTGLAADVQGLTGLRISFLLDDVASGRAQTVPSAGATVTAALSTISRRSSNSTPGIFRLDTAEGAQLSLLLPLVSGGTNQVSAVLQSPLQRALEPYFALQWQLLSIAIVALIAAAALVALLARNLSRPLSALAEASERVAGGDYLHAVEVPGRDEMSQLALAFNRMQAAVAEREERIAFQAFHDALTGLPNRAALLEHLQKTKARALRRGGSFAVLMVDINRFKEINDTLGHAVGDRALSEFAHRLAAVVRAEDYVARHGGDEFVAVLEGANAAAALGVAQKLDAGLDSPVRLGDLQVYLKTSIGIAVYPEHGEEPDVLLRRADIAMYEAKQTNRCQVYSAGRDERYLHRLNLVADLRRSISEGEIIVHYQPKADLDGGALHGFEALARWIHPRLGSVPPDEFIPLAEQSGYITALTECVLRKVIGQLQAWKAISLEPVVSVNLSALDLLNAELPVKLSRWLEEHGIAAEKLILEITESAVMRDTGYSMQVLNRLRECGVKLSIDDFGTGYSSLSQLKRLPVDELKIDKSFLMQLTDSASNDAAIVKATIELGHNMGLTVTAEGVETAACMAFLKTHNCDSVQGYIVARPMPPEEVPGWLAKSGLSS